ncbi:MAG: Maf family protein, partial [Muribaculaceae bacterium]|nr:Maf family protein [Muribaculaceae bacterium]
MHIFPDRRFILASGSPRRRELMAMLNVNFEVNTSISVDERIPSGSVTCAEEIPLYLAKIKSEPYR